MRENDKNRFFPKPFLFRKKFINGKGLGKTIKFFYSLVLLIKAISTYVISIWT